MSDTETKETEKQETTEQDEKWSKEKQRADQAEANYRKLVAERDGIAAGVSERDGKIAALEQKIADLAEAKDVPVEDLLDPDLVDAKTIKTVSKMANQIREQQKKIEKLAKLADSFQEKAKKQDAKTQKEKIIEKLLKPLDEEFGAKYRNKAKKLADSLVDEGKEQQPGDIIEANTLMRKCYLQVKKEAEEKVEKKKPVQTDNGSSSFTLDESIPKQGSRNEILAGMRKKGLALFGKS